MTAPSRSGLLIVFFHSAALCLTSCDWVTEQQGMKLPVSPFFYSLITAAGQTFVQHAQGGREGGREGGCALMHGQSPARERDQSSKEEECAAACGQ